MTENIDLSVESRQTANAILLLAAGLVFVVSLIYRGLYFMELNGSICYEMEAATRMLAGQMPYQNFYFDQPLLIVLLRMPAVILAQFIATCSAMLNHSQAALPVVPFWARAFASYLLTALLAVLSFLLSFYLILRLPVRANDLRLFYAALLGMGLANFAMGSTFGCAQHIFCLVLSPFLIVRVGSWSGAKSSAALGILCGVICGLGAGISPFFLAVIVAVELSQVVAQGLRWRKPALENYSFLLAYLLSWGWLLLINGAAYTELRDWIMPLKLSSLQLDQIAFFGLGASPDRRAVVYLCTAVMLVLFGLINKVSFLRPLAVVMMSGFSIYLATMTGLSTELDILIWSMTLALSLIAIYFIYGSSVAKFSRRVAAFTYKPTRIVRVRAALLTIFCLSGLAIMVLFETWQRWENLTVLRGATALDPDLIDVEDALLKYSKPQEKVLILNGRLLPSFPIYSLINRLICGYYISSEPLSSLACIEEHHLADQLLGKPYGWLAEVKRKMYSRIGAEVEIEKPAVIMVEGGQTFDRLQEMGILNLILTNYKMQGEARYHSRCSGTKEFADWNYRYNIYSRK